MTTESGIAMPETTASTTQMPHSVSQPAQFKVHRYGFWIVLVVAVLSRVAHLWAVKLHDPFYDVLLTAQDSAIYWDGAMRIAAGDWLCHPDPEGPDLPLRFGPLYMYFLATLFMFAGPDHDVAHAVQALLALGVPAGLYLAGRFMFGPFAALITGLLAAVCAPILFYEQTLLMEGLLLLLHTGILICFSVAHRRRGSGSLLALAAVSGLLSGLASVGRANFLLVSVGLTTCWFAYPWFLATKFSPRFKSQWVWSGIRLAVTFTIALLIPLVALLWRNHTVSEVWKLRDNGDWAFYLGNAHDSHGVFHILPESHRTLIQRYGSREAVPWAQELQRDIAEHPGAFAGLIFRKTWMFINGYDIADNYNFYLQRQFLPTLAWNPIGWRLLVPLGLLGMVITIRRWRRQPHLYVYAVLFAISIIIVFPTGRVRLPFILPMLLWSGPAVVGISRMVKQRHFSRAALCCAFVAGGAALLSPRLSHGAWLNSPPQDNRVRLIRNMDYSLFITAGQASGQTGKVRQVIQSALRDYPRDQRIALRSVQAFANFGETDNAVMVAERYMELVPADDVFKRTVAQLLPTRADSMKTEDVQ